MDNLSLAIEHALERGRTLSILKAGNFYYLDEQTELQRVFRCVNPDAYAFGTGPILYTPAFSEEKHYGGYSEVKDTSKMYTANFTIYHLLIEKYPNLTFEEPFEKLKLDSTPFGRALQKRLEDNSLEVEPVGIAQFKVPALEGGFLVQYGDIEGIKLTIERINRRRLHARTLGHTETEQKYYSLLNVVKWLEHVVHS